MKSEESKSDLDMLLNMEMKLSLLDVSDIDADKLPEKPPAIPPDPEDLDFIYCYD